MKTLGIIAAAAALACGAQAGAVTIASSSFGAGDEGWRNGDYYNPTVQTAVGYDPSGWIAVADNYGYNQFYAPTAYLGDQSAAYGGTIRFDVSDTAQDTGVATSIISLHTTGLSLYGGLITLPDLSDFTTFSVVLLPGNFYAGDPNTLSGPQATEVQLRLVLANLTAFGISADYNSGGDFVRLDNVFLTSGVPEPATWLMLALGFGVTGAAVRRRRTFAIA